MSRSIVIGWDQVTVVYSGDRSTLTHCCMIIPGDATVNVLLDRLQEKKTRHLKRSHYGRGVGTARDAMIWWLDERTRGGKETENTLDTNTLETAIIQLGDDAPTDLLLEYGDRIKAGKERIREVEQAWKAKVIERIQRDGEIVAGDWRYYIANEKDTKCNDVRATTEACMDAAAGDVDAFNGVLSTNAYKPGACRKLLPPAKFSALFTTTEKVVLKDGAAVPQLQCVNEKFVR